MTSFFREYKCDSTVSRCLLPVFGLLGKLTIGVGFRGVGTFSKILGKFLPSAKLLVSIGEHSTIEVDLLDYYWSRMIFRQFVYEPELAAVIDTHLQPDSIFIDCGANIGYWSTFMQERLQPGSVVAIEGSSSTYRKLKRNCELNGNKFEAIHAAVSDKSGQSLTFQSKFVGAGHASAHISSTMEPGCETVESIAIDDIFEKFFEMDGSRLVFIKLDVEGGEVNALLGARNVLKNNRVILLYEDHGFDEKDMVTDFIVNDIKFDVFDPMDNMKKMSSVKMVSDRKIDPTFGYNFVATNIDGFAKSHANSAKVSSVHTA